MKNKDLQITTKEGYEAMLYLFKEYYGHSCSSDLTDILSAGN